MATGNQPSKAEQDSRQEQHGVGRLANTSVQPGDMSAIPGVEAPIGQPAEAMNRDDLDAHPATADGSRDRARIVPPPNQGESDEVTDKIVGGEAGATVY